MSLKRILIAEENAEEEEQMKRAKKGTNKLDTFLFNMNNANSNRKSLSLINKQQSHIDLIQNRHELEVSELNKENVNLSDELTRKKIEISDLKLDLSNAHNELKRLHELISTIKNTDLLHQQLEELKFENDKFKQDYCDLANERLTWQRKLESLETENLHLKLDLRDMKQKTEQFERAHAKHKQIINDYCNLKIDHKMQLIQLEEKYKLELERIKMNNLS